MQQVVINGVTSSSADMLSGVTQVSAIGPLLFLIYINDVCSMELSSNYHILLSLYADDILQYKPVRDAQDYTTFQKDINTISDWVENNYLHFNVQKCKFMLVSRKRSRLPPPNAMWSAVTKGGHLEVSWADNIK